MTLDRRIAEALTDRTVGLDDLRGLIEEAQAAEMKTSEATQAERQRMLDPTNASPTKSRKMVDQLELEHARLQTALPQLRARYEKADAAEYSAQWNEQYKQVEAERDKLAAELTELYPEFVGKLVDLLNRIEAFDCQEIDRLNGSAPRGENRRLLGVELTARGLDRFTAAEPSLTENLRLPDPGDTRSFAYPPTQVNHFALEMVRAAQAVAAKHAILCNSNWAEAKALADKQSLAHLLQCDLLRR